MADFTWGSGGQKISTPEAAARQRKIADALIAQSATPGRNWSEGLADVAAALSGTVLNSRTDEAEAAGRERAGGLFADLAINSDPNSIIAALTSPDSSWASPAQTSIASALLNSGLERSDPLYQAQVAQAEAEAANGFGGSAPANVQEWNYYSQLSPEDQSRYLTMKRSNSPLNVGTGFVTQDPANPGTVIGEQIAIDNQTPAFDKGLGAGLGADAAAMQIELSDMEASMPGLMDVVDQLGQLAETATYTKAGQAYDSFNRELGRDVGQAAEDRVAFISMIDNQVLPLLRETFGAAFTVQEGANLKATMGDPNLSPREKKAALDAFIEQKVRNLNAKRERVGGQVPVAAQGQQAPVGGGSEVIDWNDL